MDTSRQERSGTSPPTNRVLDVIDLLVRQNGVPVRMAEIVRDVDLTQGTAHAILRTLCDRGWAVRIPTDKTFVLGPALAQAAASASHTNELERLAIEAVDALAERLEVATSVVQRIGDELAVIGSGGGLDEAMDMHLGDRLPYAAPFGPAFAAWEPMSERRSWVERSIPASGPVFERIESRLDRIREVGYSLERMTPALVDAARSMVDLHREPISPSVRSAVADLLAEIAAADSPSRERVTSIAAPVFDRSGGVTLNVSLHPFRVMNAREITAAAGALIAVTTTLGHAA